MFFTKIEAYSRTKEHLIFIIVSYDIILGFYNDKFVELYKFKSQRTFAFYHSYTHMCLYFRI